MRKIIMVAVVLALLVGCASKAKRIVSNQETDADKVKICTVAAKCHLSPGPFERFKDWELYYEVCSEVARQVPDDFHSSYWAGELLYHHGRKVEACKSFKEASKRGNPVPFGAYCNQDGSPK
jgi:hypothetical protein